MLRKGSIFSIVLLVSVIVGCESSYEDSVYIYQQPPETSDGWRTGTLIAHDIELEPIVEMMNKVREGHYFGINSIVLVRHGTLILDEYFESGHRDKIHTTRSASKAVTSALIGIAIEHDFIESVEAPVLSFFPEYNGDVSHWDEAKNDITLAHVLSMTSGIKGNEDAMYPTNDWSKFYFDQPLVSAPGENFSYATSGVVTLGGVIAKSSGLSVTQFADKYLFSPLGISDYFWPRTSRNLEMTGGGLQLRSRDMAKFGQLYLDKGVWQGNRVISQSWVEQSTSRHATSDLYGEDFGYMWRMIDREINDRDIRSFEAWGNGGQFIMVFPSLELVAVFTGENFGRFPEMEQPFELMDKYILPAVYH